MTFDTETAKDGFEVHWKYNTAQGENLFETFLLNLTFLKDGETLWGPEVPCWELNPPRSGERTEIPQPDNQAQLLTLQSRRLLLHRENGAVTGYSLLGGDFFQKEKKSFAKRTKIAYSGRERKQSFGFDKGVKDRVPQCAARSLAPIFCSKADKEDER